MLPSLLIATYHNPELLLAMEESVSGELIQQYLESYIAALDTRNGGLPSSTSALVCALPPQRTGLDDVCLRLLPMPLW